MSMNTEKFTFQDMQELVIAVAELFGLPDEDNNQAVINRDFSSHFLIHVNLPIFVGSPKVFSYFCTYFICVCSI